MRFYVTFSLDMVLVCNRSRIYGFRFSNKKIMGKKKKKLTKARRETFKWNCSIMLKGKGETILKAKIGNGKRKTKNK